MAARSPWWIAALVVSTVFVGWRLAGAGSYAPHVAPAAPPQESGHAAALTPAPSASVVETASPERIALGKALFFDESLSEPRGTSCASCHDPAHAFAGMHGSTIGVPLGSRPGHYAKRNAPSLLYLRYVRHFHLHWEEDAPLVDAYGGFFWDGRIDSLVDLVRQPLLNPDEMNGQSAAAVASRIATGPDADAFRREFGAALDDPETAMRALGLAIEAFLLSPPMAPFSSRYDDYVRGRAPLTPLEMRGLRLFKDSAKGGCAACHKMDDGSKSPERSLFTDYAFDAVAPPRNRAVPATRDPAYFDLGLCERRDPEYKAQAEQFCGSFRTPSLRNVAVRAAFMHNGTFHDLRDVVSFYATRSTHPKRWYRQGVVFDDVPAAYREYVQVDKAPYNRQEGETPALDEGEIDAIVAFLGTLTDAPSPSR
ncbi:MAG TPA: cytochrome c peroxidase [Polyangiaceae bacterium]|nr:cytochrome c peroxidase [Polyangiaceae bacterium]